MQNKTRIIPHLLLFAITVSTVALTSGCSDDSKAEEARTRPEGIEIRPDVIFARADAEPLYRYLESQGVVEPQHDLEIVPRISGFVAWHQITEGRRVQRGDTLLRIVDDEWKLRLAEAENVYIKAEQEYRIEKELRSRDSRGNTLSERDERILQQQTGYLQAKAALDRAILDVTYTAIVAPFSGEIHTTLNLSNGAYIGAGTRLGQLLDHRRVRVRLDVLESELGRVRPGMDVQITTPSGERLTGRLSTISPLVSRERKTGQIIVEVDNTAQKLKSGMTVNGRILTETHTGRVRVPRGVLLERDGRSLVFKLNDDMVEWVYVTPAVITPEYIILNEENFEPGDLLAVDRHFALSHQQKVNVRVLID